VDQEDAVAVSDAQSGVNEFGIVLMLVHIVGLMMLVWLLRRFL
jgi:hypothetical protein